MKIAIAGSRGIPNRYGGFEQCAEQLSVLLMKNGHEVMVYNPHYHHYHHREFQGVQIIKKWNPEKQIGTAGNFIYDYLCMQHAVKNNAAILLMLGYTTSSVFFPLLKRKNTKLITNMDGLEWKRQKWNPLVQRLTKWFEKLAVRYSDCCIADNIEIKDYFTEQYNKPTVYISYGSEPFHNPEASALTPLNLSAFQYDLLVARLEKENNIETIIKGCIAAENKIPLLIIGGTTSAYAASLVKRYKEHQQIKFIGSNYDLSLLNNLRYHSRFYFHGHSAGGTNPSLLEAMASSALIVAHDNPFNKSVLAMGFYFSSSKDITVLLNNHTFPSPNREEIINANMEKIKSFHSWKKIAAEHEKLFQQLTYRA